MKRCVLQRNFFDKPTLVVARELLGKFLVRRWRGKEIVGMITEVEAYDGFYDKASHASRGVTARNAPMFGEAGRWYVYFTYGMHWMLNVVTREKGYPAAILVRGVALAPSLRGVYSNEIVIAIRQQAEKQSYNNVRLPRARLRSALAMTTFINGPARLTKYFHIDKKLNDMPASRHSGLWVEDRGVRIRHKDVARTPRIGVAYAGKVWANKKYRFVATRHSEGGARRISARGPSFCSG